MQLTQELHPSPSAVIFTSLLFSFVSNFLVSESETDQRIEKDFRFELICVDVLMFLQTFLPFSYISQKMKPVQLS